VAKIGVLNWSLRLFIRQVGLALPSRLTMPFLLQGPHSRTSTHIHGERVRRRRAGRAGRAVGEITGDNKTVSSA